MYTNNPIDILMFGWELPPDNSGGLGVACQGLAQSLAGIGHHISFALPRPLSSRIDYMRIVHGNMPDVNVTAINSLLQSYISSYQYSHQYKTMVHRPLPRFGPSLFAESLRYAQLARQWAKHIPHNIIHAHDWMTYPAAISAAQVSKKPWVAHVHATEYDRTGDHVDPQIAQTEYQGLKQADAVITVSRFTKDTIVDKYSISPDKVHVVHNGINLTDFKPQLIRRIFPHDHIALYVGRLTFQKGVEYLLQSAKEVLDVHPNSVFIIVGDGDMYSRHILEAASLGISSRVIFTGFLSGHKLRSLYQMADVFIMPSVSEPYGLVALEAIASKTPVIISNHSGVAETISHAFKVDFWDTHQMAGLINFIFAYPHLAHEMSDLAYQEAKALTWDRSARKTLSVYQHLL